MQKSSLLLLLILLLGSSTLLAQATHQDSMVEIAKADAQNFVLNKSDLQQFRQLRRNRSRSDYFKPKAANVSDSKLLLDSFYVKAYRHTAFIETRKRHTAGHYIIIFGSIIAGLLIISAVAIVIIHGV